MPRIVSPLAAIRRRSDPGLLWDRIAVFVLAIGTALVPVTVYSGVADLWEMNKTVVAVFTVTVAWLAFCVALFRRRSLTWSWGMMDWLLLALVGAAALSTVWSVAPWQSLAGIGGWMSESLPMIAAFAAYAMLIRQVARQPQDRQIIWTAVLIGLGAAAAFQLWQFGGRGTIFPSLPKEKLFSLAANSTGSTAILAALFSVFMLRGWSMTVRAIWRWVFLVGAAVGWLILLALSRPLGWAVFSLGAVWVVWSEGQKRAKANMPLIIAAIGFMVFGLLGQLMHVSERSKFPDASEATLSTAVSQTIAGQTLRTRPILGSGPATWYQDFVSFRPDSFNLTANWNTRFIKANAEWLQLLATVGIVGTLAWLAVIGWPLWSAWKQRTKSGGYHWELLLVAAALFMTGWFSTWSFPLLLLFFLLIGIADDPQRKTQDVPFGAAPILGVTAMAILLAVFWYGAANIVMADINVQRAQNAISQTKPLDEVQKVLERAHRQNPHNASASVLLANALVTKAELDIQQQKTTNVSTLVQQAMQLMTDGVRLDPKNPAMIEAQNNLLNRVASYATGADVQAQQNFSALRKLEPSNPVHDVGYGQTLMLARATVLAAESPTAEQKKQAEDYFTKAVEAYNAALKKKSDYLQAQYSRGLAYGAVGQNAQALTEFDLLVRTYPKIAPLWTARGQVLAAMKKTTEANQSFDQAISVDAKDVNAYLAYAQAEVDAGNKDHAKEVLNNGLKAVPDDAQLKAALDGIK